MEIRKPGNIQFVADAFLNEGAVVREVDENGDLSDRNLVVTNVYQDGVGINRDVFEIHAIPVSRVSRIGLYVDALSFHDEVVVLAPEALIRQVDCLWGSELRSLLNHERSLKKAQTSSVKIPVNPWAEEGADTLMRTAPSGKRVPIIGR